MNILLNANKWNHSKKEISASFVLTSAIDRPILSQLYRPLYRFVQCWDRWKLIASFSNTNHVHTHQVRTRKKWCYKAMKALVSMLSSKTVCLIKPTCLKCDLYLEREVEYIAKQLDSMWTNSSNKTLCNM